LPVPAVTVRGDGRLRLTFMDGVHGQELIDAGQAGQVLRACGQMLRRIQAIDPSLVHVDDPARPLAVLVHGDYGPNNVLLDRAAQEIVAIVDWEWTHAGDPVEDLAWCEWVVRMHHPAHVVALSSLFDAYGHRPAWIVRQQAMVEQCRALLAFCERWEPGGPGVRSWHNRLQVTESWAE
jgi:Ser/Thr protein kinase RdoA (MazF antagonist)